jgi:hypothetical protein
MRRLLALLVVAAAACSNAPSQEQCESLLGHLIDLELAKGGGKNVTPDMKADLEKQKKQIADYTRDKFMDACMKKTAKAVIDCGTRAQNEKDLAACDETEGK